MIISSVGFGAGLVAGGTADSQTKESETDTVIEPELSESNGTVEVIVQFDAADRATVQREGTDVLKAQADATQSGLEELAAREDGITIERQFWLTNAALVEVDTDSVSLKSIAELEGVTDIHENARIELPDTKAGTEERLRTAAGTEATAGLEQIDAPTAWEQFDTRGENVTVAVLDTGIDVDHPDLELKTENETDPTYPSGWAEFDATGDPIEGSEPYESSFTSHGTHVSGTVAGGNESGTYVGVAPEADLMHGLVLPNGVGSSARAIGGMEWAVENDADVIVTSLSTVRDDPFAEVFIEPVRNANDAGVAVVAATGNKGNGTSGSPANVYESVAVGSVDSTGAVANDSSGEPIETDDWDDAPESWPDTYTVPDVAAPGVTVESTIAGGEYGTMNGTSMAAPHVGGIYALAQAEDEDHTIEEIRHALEQTAHRPDGDEIDHRYGHGIVNANRTLAALAEGGVAGTVTDEAGNPISDANVSLDGDIETTTGGDGTYEIAVADGTYDITVDAFGYENAARTVTVEGDEPTTVNVALEPALDGAVTDDQPAMIESGEAITADLEVAHGESLVVEPTADLGGNETLTVNGDTYEFGEEIPLEGSVESITIALETTAETPERVTLEYTLTGLGSETTFTSGSTAVFEDIVDIGVIDDAEDEFAQETAAVLESELENGNVTIERSDAVLGDEEPQHDVYVVQTLSTENAAAFVEATESADVGVVYLDQWGEDANGVPQYASVTGDPAETNEDDSYSTDGVEPPVSYVVEADHPIVDDAEVGDEIPIHNGSYADHAWFENTSFEVIASVTHAGTEESVGPALAVDDESNTVLASSLVSNEYILDEQLTDAANATLAESAVYAIPDRENATTGPVVQVGDAESFADYSGTATVNATADGVAGYQLTLDYDPNVVHVTGADGGDFEAPVTNVDNENGTVSIAQADADGTDEPTLTELELEFVGERGAETTLRIDDSRTQLSDEQGNAIPVDTHDGVASTLACLPGDVSGDDAVTVGDATLTQRHIVDKPIDGSSDPTCGDLNRDGYITSGDVTLILEEIVGLNQAAPLEG